MNKLNGIRNYMNNKIGNKDEKLPLALEKLQEIYVDFSRKMDKSDFCNSSRRYIVELGYVQNLKRTAQSYKIQSQVEIWEKKEQEVKSKLAEFGIKIND